MRALEDISVVNASINLPADVAAYRLGQLGATVTKVEPPDGDPVEAASPESYEELTRGQRVVRLDLKQAAGREQLAELLDTADLLLTSSRPSALARLGLSWPELERRHPQLAQVAIVGHPAPDQELAGHDLTYVAQHGLVAPPGLPRTLAADLLGAERAVSTALALLLGRERYAEVALADAAEILALPWKHGITTPEGPLGGASPFYRLYETRAGWIALAALEPRFQQRLVAGLGLDDVSAEALATTFSARSAEEWERWGTEQDVPIAAVRDVAATGPPGVET
jgi:alpha-methylacyl-CoA racemase